MPRSSIIFRGSRHLKHENLHISTGFLQETDLQGIRLFGLGNYFIVLFRKSFLKQKEEEIKIIRKRTLIELISNLFKASALLAAFLLIA